MNKKFAEDAALFKALSHPTRLFILHQIDTKKLSVRELSQMAGIDISTMSKHLDILKKNNIIEGEKVKNYIYYNLAMPCVLDFMKCARTAARKSRELGATRND